jgi:metal-sulfur cluster biosynthetic enzyme
MSSNDDTEVVRGAAGMPEAAESGSSGELAAVEDVEEAMRDVVDPELGINVVDLGLVYDIRVDEGNLATIDMTLTSAACPLTDVIEDQTRAALVGGPDGGLVNDVGRLSLDRRHRGPDPCGADRRSRRWTGQRCADQLGMDAPVGAGQDH